MEYAPTVNVRRVLRHHVGDRYFGFDIARHRNVDVLADALRLPFGDRSIDLIVCFHVLEHIPDDTGAIAEMHRVTALGGVAVVQCPWSDDRPTEEDPDAPPEERRRRFGLEDHVRRYGSDFADRLAAPGFDVTFLRAGDYLGADVASRHGVPVQSPLWLCRRR